MKNLVAFTLLLLAHLAEFSCYCPPLIAPASTELTCKEPIKHQTINCSASWLPAGTVAYFRCFKERSKRAKGRITCSEDGIHRHVQKQGLENFAKESLPCGIKKDFQKSDIHIYGFQAPIHYDLKNGASLNYQLLGETLHNEFRQTHGVPPLQLQANLSHLAQNWADRISMTGRLDMAPNLSFGQNIFMAQTGSNLTTAVNDAVHNWYHAGIAEYCWDDVTGNWSNSLSLDFSQLVWKDSRFLGIGASTLKSGKGVAVIAFYDPAGNIIIDDDEESSEKIFEMNVLPMRKVDRSTVN